MSVAAREAAPTFWPAVGLLGVAVVLGGGGSPATLSEAAVQLAALLALAVAIAVGWRPLGTLRADRAWSVALLLILGLPVIQLVPLPPGLAAALPGHAPQTAALAAVGQGAAWRPWSLAPDDTAAAALALVPAVATALLVAAQPTAGRRRLMAVLAGAGLVAAVLGMVQFASGPERPLSLYADVHRGFGVGFFANRNAAADLLVIALIAAVLLADRARARLREPVAAWAAGLGFTVLGAGIVATGSRMGLVLALIPGALGLVLAPPRWRVWAGGAALLAAGALVLSGSALDRVWARASDGVGRADIWANSVPVARTLWPMGGGMGGFSQLYAAAEPLDAVQPAAVNRAHDEYLELAIEGGAPALMLLAGTFVFVGRRSWRAAGSADPDRRLLARFAGLSLLVLALHAIVDYPLRTETMLTIAGLAAGALAFPPGAPHNPRGSKGNRGGKRAQRERGGDAGVGPGGVRGAAL